MAEIKVKIPDKIKEQLKQQANEQSITTSSCVRRIIHLYLRNPAEFERLSANLQIKQNIQRHS